MYSWSDGTTTDKSIQVDLEPYALPDYFGNLAQDVTITYDGTAHKWTEGFSAIAGDSDLAENGLFLYCTGGGTKDAATSFTNAGSYEITLTPRNCCTWSDGSYAPKTFTFTIEKAEQTFTVTDDAGNTYTPYYDMQIMLTPKVGTVKFTFTRQVGDGELQSTSGSNYLATHAGWTKNNNVISFTATEACYWHRTEAFYPGNSGVSLTDGWENCQCYLKETDNYKKSKVFQITVVQVAMQLEDLSWGRITSFARNGTLAKYFDVGETKKLTVKGSLGSLNFGSGTELKAVLMGINHNAAIEGNKRAHFAVFRATNSIMQWRVLSPEPFTEGMSGSDGEVFTFNYDPDNFYSLIDGGPAPYIRECKKYNGREYEIKKIWRMSWYEWRGTTNKSMLPSGYSEDYSFQERYEFFAAGNTFQTATYEYHLYTYFGNWSRSTDGTNYLGLYMGRMYTDNPCLQYGLVPCFTV